MPPLGPSAIAGACAGLVSSIVTCPLDVVKTKLQAQSTSKVLPVTAGVPQAGAIPSTSFQSNSSAVCRPNQVPHHGPAEQGHRVYKGLIGELTVQSDQQGSTDARLCATASSTACSLSCRLAVGTLRTIYRDDGVRGFYRGLGPTIFGYLPTWAIYFTVYDGCKDFLASTGDIRQRGEEDFVNHILSALTAGAASTICTSPLWVVKTRFMVSLWWSLETLDRCVSLTHGSPCAYSSSLRSHDRLVSLPPTNIRSMPSFAS